VLCSYFKDVFVKEGYWNGDTSSRQDPEMEIMISKETVKRTLKDLKPDKSPGTDGIHPLLLRNAARKSPDH